MKISGNEIRVGMLIEHKDDLWQVLKTQHVKPGKGGAFAQIEMKSVNRNTKLNERFRSSDSVEKASLDEIKFNFLYEDETDYYFIDQKSFEHINIKKDFVGEKGSTSMGLNMTSGGGYYYIVGYGEEIKILAVDVIIAEKNIIGNLVGTWSELYELMELADKGLVKLSMAEYKLDDANKALHDLNDGKVKGRAVLVP